MERRKTDLPAYSGPSEREAALGTVGGRAYRVRDPLALGV
jgi:hypothetical protein